jgi:leucyl-tRNA synthetase
MAAEEILQIVIQLNGKVRDRIEVAATTSAEIVQKSALDQERIQEVLQGKTPKRIIYVPGKLVNIVI